jgi:hypothetical protein
VKLDTAVMEYWSADRPPSPRPFFRRPLFEVKLYIICQGIFRAIEC